MGRFKEALNEEVLILHGALGTELEFKGYDVSGKLWSAKYLLEEPTVIQEIHETYLTSGADLITTSSYQATLPGLQERGLSPEKAEEIIRLTVTLAKNARYRVWQTLSEEEKKRRIYPLISGDVGPYAAYLADGSEYTGDYGDISKEELKAFHRPRIRFLVEEGIDLLAIETIPNGLEAEAILELLKQEFSDVEAYMSFTAQNDQTISDGTPIETLAQLIHQSQQVLALGINCSSPTIYSEFLKRIASVTNKPLVTYPNSGEVYDGLHQRWTSGGDKKHDLLENTLLWRELGAKVVGGCCRTRPNDIRILSKGLTSYPTPKSSI